MARWREDIDGAQLVEAMLVSPADEELLAVLRQPALPGQLPPTRVHRLVP